MLDYHTHLVPHSVRRRFTADDVRGYAVEAAEGGLAEIALTEHFFRFPDCQDLVGRWWEAGDDARLQAQTEEYLAVERLEQTLAEYVAIVLEAAADPAPGAARVRLGLEVDWFPDHMDVVGEYLAQHPFDLLLGSVHWVGAWGLDQADDPVVMDEWRRRDPDEVWDDYTAAIEGVAASEQVDVLAHVDLVKLVGVVPADPTPYYERLVKAAVTHGLSVEISSAGWRKPVGEAYPAPALLERFAAAGVGITLASDAHARDLVGDRVGDVLALARAAGYSELTTFERRQRGLLALPAEPEHL